MKPLMLRKRRWISCRARLEVHPCCVRPSFFATPLPATPAIPTPAAPTAEEEQPEEIDFALEAALGTLQRMNRHANG